MTHLNVKISTKTQPGNVKLHYNLFCVSWIKKTFLTKMNMTSCILLVMLLLLCIVLLKTKFPSSDTFPKLYMIVSSIGNFNYDLICFLCHLLSPKTPDDYHCKDTFSFVSQLKNTNNSGKFVVSYNATSLFTNSRLQETIDIAINFIFLS